MPRFMVGSKLALCFADHAAFFLRPGDDLGDRFLYLVHANLAPVAPRRQQSRFVQHILNVRRRKARRPARKHFSIHFIVQRFVF